jgi:DNA-binding XRE family transcriptional regulator/quercetin dioxygenase-like cupin family protein
MGNTNLVCPFMSTNVHDHAHEVTLSLGHRLHAMRESRQWTLDALAERTGLSKAYLSRLESGARQPSIGVLCTIAKSFGVSISTLFEQPDEVADCVIIRGGSVDERSVNGLRYQPLSSSTKPFNLQPIDVTIPANRSGDQVYQHEGEEWLLVTQGRVQLSIGQNRYQLETGDSAHFCSQLGHRLDALDGKDARIILVACPIPVALNHHQREARSLVGQFAGQFAG